MFDSLRQQIRNMQPPKDPIGWTGQMIVNTGMCSIDNAHTGEYHRDITREEADKIIGDAHCFWVSIKVREKVD